MIDDIEFNYPADLSAAAGTANSKGFDQLSKISSTNYSDNFSINNSNPLSDKKESFLKSIGYHPMDPEMDDAFFSLYKEFITNPTIEIDKFVFKFFPNFKKSSIGYFNRHPFADQLQDKFINNLSYIWVWLLTLKHLGDAQQYWNRVLSLIKSLERKILLKRIHKGAIYYYWGGTAILEWEAEKGYSLMGAALLEDDKTYPQNAHESSAYRFVYLDYKNERQYFKKLLQDQGNVLEEYISKYNSEKISFLDGESFRNKFLAIHPKPEAVLLLAYTIARIENKKRYTQQSSKNLFEGILDLNLLFDLTLVIELSIKTKSPINENLENFYKCAVFLSKKAKLNLHKNFLNSVILEKNSDKQIKTIISKLLDRSFKPKDIQYSAIEKDIAIAYLLRNHAAHNIDPQSLVPKLTQALLQSLFNVLFFTVEVLY